MQCEYTLTFQASKSDQTLTITIIDATPTQEAQRNLLISFQPDAPQGMLDLMVQYVSQKG